VVYIGLFIAIELKVRAGEISWRNIAAITSFVIEA
jgi:hypothetical protein